VASRTELTRQFMQHQQDREIDKTIAMLAEDVVSTNPLQGTMSGKAAVEASMRAGPPGGGPQLPTGCAEQLTARAMTYIGSIDLRRIWIADEENGLVFAYTMFRHPLDAPNRNYPVLLPDGTISDRMMGFEPFDLEAAHIYKIYGGTMHEIEAMGFTLPLNSKNGWSPFIK